eukprot:3789196-Heterocapsa_arctica.AAC.1
MLIPLLVSCVFGSRPPSEAGGGRTASADRSLPGGHPRAPGCLHRPAEDLRIPRLGRTRTV